MKRYCPTLPAVRFVSKGNRIVRDIRNKVDDLRMALFLGGSIENESVAFRLSHFRFLESVPTGRQAYRLRDCHQLANSGRKYQFDLRVPKDWERGSSASVGLTIAAANIELDELEGFAYVLTVLERYPDRQGVKRMNLRRYVDFRDV